MNDVSAIPDVTEPLLRYPPYVSTRLRAPSQPLVILPERLSDVNAPVFGWWSMYCRQSL
jgi:hypothetical protein